MYRAVLVFRAYSQLVFFRQNQVPQQASQPKFCQQQAGGGELQQPQWQRHPDCSRVAGDSAGHD